jgi:hypothetical protein
MRLIVDSFSYSFKSRLFVFADKHREEEEEEEQEGAVVVEAIVSIMT